MTSTLFGIAFSIFVFLLLIGFGNPQRQSCSWSNEHCSRDSDCCSHSCYRAFEGTNPRCRHSTLSESCIFSFHCADDLECGPYFNCCSPYWKMCMKDADCCDPMHVCKPADGFYYDRCLYPSSADSVYAVLEWNRYCPLLNYTSILANLCALAINHWLTSYQHLSWFYH